MVRHRHVAPRALQVSSMAAKGKQFILKAALLLIRQDMEIMQPGQPGSWQALKPRFRYDTAWK